MTVSTERTGRRTVPIRTAAKAVLRFVVPLVVFAVPMTATLQLKHAGERGVESQRNLQTIATELQLQHSLEWKAISRRVPAWEIRNTLAASRARVATLLRTSTLTGLHAGALTHLVAFTGAYTRAVDEELRLLEAGNTAEAAMLDKTEVDPAFDQALDDLAESAAVAAASATRARRLSDAGLLLIVLASLVLTSVVQSRRRRANVFREAERRSDARYRALIDQSTELVVVMDREGTARFLSPSAERLLQVQPGPAATTKVNLLLLVATSDRFALATALRTAAPGRAACAEVRIPDGDGVRTFDITVQDLTEDPSVGGLVLTAHDVTDRLALQQEMEHRALHDALTGLPNRALLADRFDQALSRDQRDGTATGLLLIDLDRFKEINDTFGHHYGDVLLSQVGPRITGVLRGVDTVARLGGDEFAVLLPDVHTVEDVTRVAGKILAALRPPFQVGDLRLEIEASIGAVLSGEHGTERATLLQRADIAMYAAKSHSLGVSTYDPTVDANSSAKLALLWDLRRALELGQLLLHYQPKISLTSGEVIGVEALVRWRHPKRGLLFPDSFLPLAEQTGLIGPLTHYVLDAALAQARVWADSGHLLPVSVNLSARNLVDERLPDEIAELLATHGIPAGLLELEITESAIMTEPVRAQRLLQRLVALGVRLSIDDFGAGYTSLALLKTLPVTELKIDKSFVLTMTEEPSNALIVSSVIDLGHNLGLTLVAEGVETEQALTALARSGCDVAQGFHLSPPMVVEDFDAWRAARRTPLRPSVIPSQRDVLRGVHPAGQGLARADDAG